MNVYIKIEVESPQRQWQPKRQKKAKAVVYPLPKVSHRQKQPCDWGSLLDSAMVLYEANLPKCWKNQLLDLPFVKAKRVVLKMKTYREHRRYPPIQI